jgi:hypothetical protein
MNRKQNILLCYFTIAISSLAILGFLGRDFGTISGIKFSLIILSLHGLVALIVTRGDDGIDTNTFMKSVFPVLLIPFYFFISGLFLSIFYDNFHTNLNSNEIEKIIARGELSKDKFSFTYDGDLSLKKSTVKLVETFKDGPITPIPENETVNLTCNNIECSGYRYNKKIQSGSYSWSIRSVTVRASDFLKVLLGCFFLIYIPIGMAIVLLTSAKNHFNDKIPEHVPFLNRFALFAISYISGIIFFPFYLNSWFTKKKKRSLLDDFNNVVNSASVGKSNADINLAIELTHTELLCEVISKNEISKLANEISIEQIELSTNDLALVTALFFFSKVELKESLSDVQFLARLKLQEWIQTESVNLIVAKMFEDTLYKNFN